jgi:hypothetical protein
VTSECGQRCSTAPARMTGPQLGSGHHFRRKRFCEKMSAKDGVPKPPNHAQKEEEKVRPFGRENQVCAQSHHRLQELERSGQLAAGSKHLRCHVQKLMTTRKRGAFKLSGNTERRHTNKQAQTSNTKQQTANHSHHHHTPQHTTKVQTHKHT